MCRKPAIAGFTEFPIYPLYDIIVLYQRYMDTLQEKGDSDMRKRYKMMMVLVVFMSVVLMAKGETVLAKTTTIKLNLRGIGISREYPKGWEKVKKATIKVSKKSIVKVKYKRYVEGKDDGWIEFIGKKKGTATVTVKCKLKNNKKKTYKYKVKVYKSKEVTYKDLAKKAFKIQNKYRKAKGVQPLQWSEEVYKFCEYRLNTSGFDRHKYILRDERDYFGDFAVFSELMPSENLHSGYGDPEKVMKAWKKSSGHYDNLMDSKHKCGAIACNNGVWVAIFYNCDKSVIDNWRDYKLKAINVRRFDSQINQYCSDSEFAYYEVDNRRDSMKINSIVKPAGKRIYLEIGKTYTFYERVKPDGCEDKAERVTITVTEDGIEEVILKS